MYALTRSKQRKVREKIRDDGSTRSTTAPQVIAPCPRYAFSQCYQQSTLRAESPHPSIASVSAASLGCYRYNDRQIAGDDDLVSLPAVLMPFHNNNRSLPQPNYAAAPSLASQKKQRLQKEMQLLDRKLRHLDMKEASRKNRLNLESASNSVVTGKGPRLFSPGPSGESSTMAMTLSSNSDDITELKDLLQKEITINHSTIGVDDDDSVCSDVTAPLTPQEELDRFLHSEIRMGEQDFDEASYSVRTTTTITPRPGLLETSSVTGSSMPVRQSKSSISRRTSKSPTRSGSKSPRRSTKSSPKRPFRHPVRQMNDTGDAQPGRVKNMPWLLTFADDRPPISTLFTGPLQGGVPHGVGTFRYRSNGDILYMGEIEHGRMHGFGMYRTTSGTTTAGTGSAIDGSAGGAPKLDVESLKFAKNNFRQQLEIQLADKQRQ